MTDSEWFQHQVADLSPEIRRQALDLIGDLEEREAIIDESRRAKAAHRGTPWV